MTKMMCGTMENVYQLFLVKETEKYPCGFFSSEEEISNYLKLDFSPVGVYQVMIFKLNPTEYEDEFSKGGFRLIKGAV